MNPTHLHLLVNHVSLFAVAFGVVALFWSVLKRSNEMRVAAVGLFLLAGLFAWVATESGEDAAERIKSEKARVETHEEAAEAANAAVIALAIGAVVLEIVARVKKSDSKTTKIGILILVLALAAAGLLARAANLGGQIVHFETRPDAAPFLEQE